MPLAPAYMGRKRFLRMLLLSFRTALSDKVSCVNSESVRTGLRPVVFVPRTLGRTWGTRPEGWVCSFVSSRRYPNLVSYSRAVAPVYPTKSTQPSTVFADAHKTDKTVEEWLSIFVKYQSRLTTNLRKQQPRQSAKNSGNHEISSQIYYIVVDSHRE